MPCTAGELEKAGEWGCSLHGEGARGDAECPIPAARRYQHRLGRGWDGNGVGVQFPQSSLLLPTLPKLK